MIRDLKDIPIKQVAVNIPQLDYTEEERIYYQKEFDKQRAEMMGCHIDENGRCIMNEKPSFLQSITNLLFQ